ncbi:hypothetical protein JCM3765_006068 [Sporobolomyces pararoseus]
MDSSAAPHQQQQAPPPVSHTRAQPYREVQLQASSARSRPQAVQQQQQTFIAPPLKKARPSAAAHSRPVSPPAPAHHPANATRSLPAERPPHTAPGGKPSRRSIAISEQPPAHQAARRPTASTSTIKPRASKIQQPRRSSVPTASSSRRVPISRIEQALPKSRPRSGGPTHVSTQAQDPDLGYVDPQSSVGEEEEGTDFDEDEEELYDSLVGAADLIVRKTRERRLERQQHNEEARARLEGPLLDFMNTVADDNAKMIARAKALSITATDPNNPGALNPAQSLMSACQETINECDSLWNELQYQLDNYDAPAEELTRTDPGSGQTVGASGAGAGR